MANDFDEACDKLANEHQADIAPKYGGEVGLIAYHKFRAGFDAARSLMQERLAAAREVELDLANVINRLTAFIKDGESNIFYKTRVDCYFSALDKNLSRIKEKTCHIVLKPLKFSKR